MLEKFIDYKISTHRQRRLTNIISLEAKRAPISLDVSLRRVGFRHIRQMTRFLYLTTVLCSSRTCSATFAKSLQPHFVHHVSKCLSDPRQQRLKATADPLSSLYLLCLRFLLPGCLLRNRIFYQLSTVCCLVRWFAVVLVFRPLDSNCQNASLLEFAAGNK